MTHFPAEGVRAGGCVPYLLTLSDSHELNERNLTSQATQGWAIGLVRLAKGGGEKKEEEKEKKQLQVFNLHHRRAWLQSRDRFKCSNQSQERLDLTAYGAWLNAP